MGWSHPEISLEDLLKLIKGFVDIIILASGYQSSGLAASWDSQNIKKALKWGFFFENVFTHLRSSGDYQGSMMELDVALLEITSDPYFPQGLKHLSSADLSRAREFLLRHFIHTLPLRDAHLTGIVTAAVEMDLEDLRAEEYDCLSVYLEWLMLHNTNPNPHSPQVVRNGKTKENSSGNHSECIVHELSERKSSVSRVSLVETSLTILSKILAGRKWFGSGNSTSDVLDEISLQRGDQMAEFDEWSKWRTRSLSYLLDRKTVKLLSGAKVIFSAPKVQWVRMFERLLAGNDADLHEILELSLLGCISSKWSRLLQHFTSVSYEPLPITKQYHELHNLLQGRSQFQHPNEDTMNAKENGILQYLAVLLSMRFHHLWKLSPILSAIAIPSWSPLFKYYLSGIETLLKGYPYTIRCCSCIQDGKEHKNCELAERIWCLYIFHVQGSRLMVTTSSS